jgi:hypothetical protein
MYPAKVSEDIHLAKPRLWGESFFVAAGESTRFPWRKGILRQLKLAATNTIEARFRADNRLRLLKDIPRTRHRVLNGGPGPLIAGGRDARPA